MKQITYGIAIYNVAPYLRQCIESVMAQSGDDVEILLVDDGSTDGSAEICDACRAKDSRIRVFHKKNGGVSTVRNLIIDEAEGKWIFFVDGDDLLSPDCVKNLRRFVESTYDIVYFNMVFFRRDDSVFVPPVFEGTEVMGDDVKNVRRETLYRDKQTKPIRCNTLKSVCAKMYRRDFLVNHSLRMSEQLLHSEDVAFNFACLEYCKSLYLSGEYPYYYRKNPNSAVNRFHPKLPMVAASFAQIVGEELSDTELKKWFYLREMTNVRSCLKQYFCHKDHPGTVSQRADEFWEFTQSDWFQEMLLHSCVDAMSEDDALVYHAVQNHDFKSLDAHYHRKARRESFKKWLDKLGILKLVRAVLRRKG